MKRSGIPSSPIAKQFEKVYRRYARRERAMCDPVQFLYRYPDLRDREIAALVASSLAYGRVAQICESVKNALGRMPGPSEFLRSASRRGLRLAFSGFRHRFTGGDDLASLLWRARGVIERFGSLESCFIGGMGRNDETVIPGLINFVRELTVSGSVNGNLLPSPAGGSACKRLNLFLRWMVRRDEVDPGGWSRVPASKLIIPLDTHMHRICRGLGFTGRGQADMRAAIEATGAFRAISPSDPVRYDFALTQMGISGDPELRLILNRRRRKNSG